MCVNECVGGGGRSDVHETTSYSKEKRKHRASTSGTVSLHTLCFMYIPQ